MGRLALTTTLEKHGPAAAIVLTDEQVATIGEGPKRFPVVATVNGYTWRTSVARMGGEFLLGLSKEVRTGVGAEAGDTVEAVIELDAVPREVDVPPTLATALAGDAAAKAAYDGLAFTDRKEFARWIAEAKKDETRDRRVAQALEMLHEGRTRS